jgi:hypothetical protein
MRLRFVFAMLCVATAFGGGAMGGVELTPAAVDAFLHYIQLTEAHIAADATANAPFVAIDALPPKVFGAALAELRSGHVMTTQLRTLDGGKAIASPGALIKHWRGTVFVPGVPLARVTAIFQDYDRHQDYFSATVVRSKLIARHDNDFKVYLRFKLVKVWTAILNTEHDVHYEPLGPGRLQFRASSTRVAQVEDADTPAEHEDPIGRDDGFLWRVNSYWRVLERDGGCYVQCEWIAMGRDIPFLFRWIIEPMLTGFSKDVLVSTLESARAASLRAAPGY